MVEKFIYWRKGKNGKVYVGARNEEKNKFNYVFDGYSNFEIYYKNERLKSIEELAERLF